MGKRKQSNKKPQNADKVASREPAMTKPSANNNNGIDSMTEKQKNDLLKKLLQEQSKATATTANGNDDEEEEEPKKKKAKEVSSSSEADELDEESSDGGIDDDEEEKKEDDGICGSETPSGIFLYFCPADKLFYKTPEDVKNATERFNENDGSLCGSKTPSKTHMLFCPADKMFYKTLEDAQKAADRFNNNKKQDGDDKDNDDDDMEPVGEEEQSPTHMYYCTGDGLFYRTYEDMAKAKKRSNQKRLQQLGLDKASADMRAVTSSKRKTNKKRPPTKKKQGTSKPPVRRSTRPSIPVIAPLPPPTVNTLFEGLEDEDADGDGDDDDTSKQSQEDIEPNESGRSEEKDGEVDGGEDDDASDEDDDMESGKADPWTFKYQELKIFHKEKGHCKVPQRYSSNPALGIWVKKQRQRYKLFNEGKKSEGMTQAQIDKLNKIGFYWGKTRSAPPVAWEIRFNELKDHYEIFGDCNIKMKPKYADCSPLAKWIRLQRHRYNLLKNGVTSNIGITKERIQKLNGIGFDWNGPRSTK